MRTDSDNRVALITGASSGIGEVTAEKLAEEGFHVVILARRETELRELTDRINKNGGKAAYLCADLASETNYVNIHQTITNKFGPIDILVNNAGLAWYGFGEEMPWNIARQMIEVNMVALTRLTLLFMAEMKARNRGHIINVGSIVGSLPSQGVALYAATKSFVDSLTTSLYRELRGTSVHISVVRAGAVATPFFDKLAERPNSMRIPISHLTIRPETVAKRILRLIRKPRRIAYVPRILWVVPRIEMTFGWLIDLIGPLLLRIQHKRKAAC